MASPADAALHPDTGALIRLLTDQAPVVLWTTDRELRFTSSMGAALKHLGTEPHRAVGTSLYDYFGTHDASFPPIAHHLKALAGEKTSYEFEWAGRVFHTLVEPFAGPGGEVIGTLGLALDITERKRAESALQDSEARWKAVVTQAPDFVTILDKEGRIFYINHVKPGYNPEEVIGTCNLDFLMPKSRPVALAAYRRAAETGEVVTYEVSVDIRGQGECWFRNRVGPLHRNGKIANLILISTDITESKRAEAALKDSLDQLRRLAARLQSVREEERKRIALDIHDRLGQALTGLKLDLSSLSPRLGKDQEGRRRVKALFRSLDETIQTVREISTGLRPAILDNLGLKAAIEWQAREFQGRTGARLRLDLPARDVRLDADLSTALFRIFQEILTNVARHARAREVTVSLKTSPREVSLMVTDDGKGIARKSLQDPSSLGLLGMRERALAFGGTVDVQRRRGGGTALAVTIPSPRRKRKK